MYLGKLQKDSLWAVASENYWCKMIINYSFPAISLDPFYLLYCSAFINLIQAVSHLIFSFHYSAQRAIVFCNYGNKTIVRSDLTSHSFRHLS